MSTPQDTMKEFCTCGHQRLWHYMKAGCCNHGHSPSQGVEYACECSEFTLAARNLPPVEPSAEKEYRMLEEEDVRKQGDEVEISHDRWVPVDGTIGWRNLHFKTRCRRPIPASVSPSAEVGGEEDGGRNDLADANEQWMCEVADLKATIQARTEERNAARAQIEELRREMQLEKEITVHAHNRAHEYEAQNESLRSSAEELAKALELDAMWIFDGKASPVSLRAEYREGGGMGMGPNNCSQFYAARKQALATFRASQGEEKGGQE